MVFYVFDNGFANERRAFLQHRCLPELKLKGVRVARRQHEIAGFQRTRADDLPQPQPPHFASVENTLGLHAILLPRKSGRRLVPRSNMIKILYHSGGS
jgi:hypothetical protein